MRLTIFVQVEEDDGGVVLIQHAVVIHVAGHEQQSADATHFMRVPKCADSRHPRNGVEVLQGCDGAIVCI